MRKKITVRGVDGYAIEMLNEIREEERRVTGAIISSAIERYWEYLFDYSEDQ